MAAESSTFAKGNSLERRIFELFKTEIDADRFWAKQDCCKIFWKKGYFSRDRGTDIIFDVAIEVYLPGAQDYSCLVLIECKNYQHPVPVDDVEEFFAKVQQVAAAKGKAIVASVAAFQSGAREFARSKGIGLMRYFGPEDFKWELKRSPSASSRSGVPEAADLIASALSTDTFQSLAFDLYLQSPIRETNSLWSFFEDLVVDALGKEQACPVANRRSSLNSRVPFYDKNDLEDKATNILAELDYSRGVVDLDLLCEHEAIRSGLKVERDVPVSVSPTNAPVLGRITFDPPVIQIYAAVSPHPARARFTLAHELSHHLLNHGRFLIRESCDDTDFSLDRSFAVEGADVARMELQANLLAASLLMPRIQFTHDFLRFVKVLDIPNRGFGQLYVDNQPCNLRHFDAVTNELMQKYGVSRQAAKIRLESLGLLTDARGLLGCRSVQSILAESHG
ncbi:ImmA/IrrE family metallo-endopeptidase [Achromobacter veterisilvae]|uniref:ImmA/IrrE family metallo-endopeptidase n=1 Tax=Achromobacter veterisilvae TaxID=2069367 RepID=A0ABZ2S1T0_9BURK